MSYVVNQAKKIFCKLWNLSTTTNTDLFKTFVKNNGGAMRDRTADLLDANQALSQLSYSPSLT